MGTNNASLFFNLVLILIILCQVNQIALGYDCFDAYSCSSTLINQTDGDDINCFGYKSCFQSPGLHNYVSNINCYGSYSCYNTTWIKIYTTTMSIFRIKCYGLNSCAHSNHKLSGSGRQQIQCYGEQSCINSNVLVDSHAQYYENYRVCTYNIFSIVQHCFT